jgi:hypothetical protein
VTEIGKVLLVLGLVTAAVGALMLLGVRVPFFGRLPGDLSWRKGNLTIYVPLVTSVVVSLLLTLVVWLVRR